MISHTTPLIGSHEKSYDSLNWVKCRAAHDFLSNYVTHPTVTWLHTQKSIIYSDTHNWVDLGNGTITEHMTQDLFCQLAYSSVITARNVVPTEVFWIVLILSSMKLNPVIKSTQTKFFRALQIEAKILMKKHESK